MASTLKGISFPFRVGAHGGIAMTEVTSTDIKHILEKIQIVLTTFRGERTMEQDICSQLDSLMFEENEKHTHTLLEYQIETALNKTLKEYIDVRSVHAHADNNLMYADVKIYVKELGKDINIKNLKVGESENAR